MNINKTIYNLCRKAERGKTATYKKINMTITDIHYIYSTPYTAY